VGKGGGGWRSGGVRVLVGLNVIGETASSVWTKWE